MKTLITATIALFAVSANASTFFRYEVPASDLNSTVTIESAQDNSVFVVSGWDFTIESEDAVSGVFHAGEENNIGVLFDVAENTASIYYNGLMLLERNVPISMYGNSQIYGGLEATFRTYFYENNVGLAGLSIRPKGVTAWNHFVNNERFPSQDLNTYGADSTFLGSDVSLDGGVVQVFTIPVPEPESGLMVMLILIVALFFLIGRRTY